MNKTIKYSFWVIITIFSFLWIVFAANTISSLTDTINEWDTISASWFNEVNSTVLQNKEILSWTKSNGKVCTFNAGKISCINDLPSWGATASGVVESFFSQQQDFQVGENSQKNLWNFSICTLTRTSTAEADKHDNWWQYRGSCELSKTAWWWVLKSQWKWRCEASCFGPWTAYLPPPPPACIDQWPNKCCDWLSASAKYSCMNEIPF